MPTIPAKSGFSRLFKVGVSKRRREKKKQKKKARRRGEEEGRKGIR